MMLYVFIRTFYLFLSQAWKNFFFHFIFRAFDPEYRAFMTPSTGKITIRPIESDQHDLRLLIL